MCTRFFPTGYSRGGYYGGGPAAAPIPGPVPDFAGPDRFPDRDVRPVPDRYL